MFTVHGPRLTAYGFVRCETWHPVFAQKKQREPSTADRIPPLPQSNMGFAREFSNWTGRGYNGSRSKFKRSLNNEKALGNK